MLEQPMSVSVVCMVVVVVGVVMVEGVVINIVRIPTLPHSTDAENCSVWLEAIPSLSLLSLYHNTSASNPSTSHPLHTSTPQTLIVTPQPATTTTYQPSPSANSNPRPRIIPEPLSPLTLATTTTTTTAMTTSKLPPMAKHLRLPTRFEPKTPLVTRTEPHSDIPTTFPHQTLTTPSQSVKGSVISGIISLVQGFQPNTTHITPVSTNTSPQNSLGAHREILIIPSAPSAAPGIHTQIPAPTSHPGTTDSSLSPSSATSSLGWEEEVSWGRVEELLRERLPSILDPHLAQLLSKPYKERLIYANHEMVDRVLQKPLDHNTTEKEEEEEEEEEGEEEEEEGFRCGGTRLGIKGLEEHLTELQKVVALLLMPLPQSLEEVREVARDPEIDIHFFRPERKSVLDVGVCRQCYARDPRGVCRQLFFCKDGASVASRQRFNQAELLRLING